MELKYTYLENIWSHEKRSTLSFHVYNTSVYKSEIKTGEKILKSFNTVFVP